MSEKETDILQSLLAGWAQSDDMPLVGGLSYNELFDWLKANGVDTQAAEDKLDARLKEYESLLQRRLK